jgi:hypothetical protein
MSKDSVIKVKPSAGGDAVEVSLAQITDISRHPTDDGKCVLFHISGGKKVPLAVLLMSRADADLKLSGILCNREKGPVTDLTSVSGGPAPAPKVPQKAPRM